MDTPTPIRQYAPEQIQAVDAKWQAYWQQHGTFDQQADHTKPKYYVLDMFPYPSGAGLHVGHPLGYIATDILARWKRQQGYNVLHPMGYDAFGLPAEQYAIQTGTHPAITTARNIETFARQLQMIGLAYDRQSQRMKTCDPQYYRWTQWLFRLMFESWYNPQADRAESIDTLRAHLSSQGTAGLVGAGSFTAEDAQLSAADWSALDLHAQEAVLQKFRLAYLSESYVNWCPALGTVLANEEVKDGVSERGGHPVERKQMRQWSLRITAYAERLLRDLDTIDWPDAVKEMQRHWIGRSQGAHVRFAVQGTGLELPIFTTRPDTIFGATFMVVAPESDLARQLATPAQLKAVNTYIDEVSHRSERDRLADTKRITGVFTGSYAVHPFTGEPIPIWLSEYVLAGYGTGAIMAVPGHDSRDWAFAQHFELPIAEVVAGGDISQAAHETKEGTLVNSGFLDGLQVPEAIERAIQKLEELGIGKRQVNFRLRDAIFGRQRYWGEPFPIVYEGNTPVALPESELPVELPQVQSYKPTGTGDSPLAAVTDWVNRPDGTRRETDTMPGWAGSSWYFFRYVAPQAPDTFAPEELVRYWLPVDLYVGGTEHAVGHLLYARHWTKFLYDRGFVSIQEPFARLVNQGMIQGRSSLVMKAKDRPHFVSWNRAKTEGTESLITVRVPVGIVKDDKLDTDALRKWLPEYATATFDTEADGSFVCGWEVEKMSKSYHNVVVPDDLCQQYGADTFRMYEMFLGPLEAHKPWNTNGITGVHNFLRKVWGLFYQGENWVVTDEAPTPEALKALHKLIQKIGDDLERLAFNTSVSSFMIAVNELQRLQCRSRAVLADLLRVLAPFAPHIAEELWQQLHAQAGEAWPGSIADAGWPAVNPDYLVEDSFSYPVQVNGKKRFELPLSLDLSPADIEAAVRQAEALQPYTQGTAPKKVIVVPGKIVNVVV